MAFSPTKSHGFKPLSPKKSAVVSVLDIGSNKVCCLIARLRPLEGVDVLPGRTHSIEILGLGHQVSRGIKSGVVVDLDGAEQSIRLAVDSAERLAGITIESLIVSLSSGRLQSEGYSAEVALSGSEVSQADIQKVLRAGSDHSVSEGRQVIHSLPIGYALDGNRGIDDPCGMIGRELGVDMHVVSADQAPLRNLELCINRCHLSVETFVAAPYASGLACLVEDEAGLGVTCVDMGAGTTTMSIFMDGHFVHSDAIAVGGHHVTTDLARGLSCRMSDAERIKTLHGSALPSVSEDRDILTIPQVVDDEDDVPNQVPRSMLTRIIRPRVEEILELVRDRLAASGYGGQVGRRIVLTGGASQLTGMTESARRIIGRNVRLGRPLGVVGLPEAAKGPAFSTSVGLLIYPQIARGEETQPVSNQNVRLTGTDGYLARVGQWFKESF